MSFSGDVKEELCKRVSTARHCQIAEIAALLELNGTWDPSLEKGLVFRTENVFVARKYFTLLKKTFKISVTMDVSKNHYLKKNNLYSMVIGNGQEAEPVVNAIQHSTVLQKNCCKRAYIRGAFLAAGSISDPEKFYHLEVVCPTMEQAQRIQEQFQSLSLDARIVQRKKVHVVYIKEGAQIVDALGLMEANLSLMKLENIRILKEMRNSVNRQVNCETANLNKTISAAVRQVRDIEYIRDTVGLSALAPNLQQMAEIRLEYPEASLQELGELLSPSVGKSGVNHRLRKLSNIAEDLRGNKEENYYDKKNDYHSPEERS